ncbi:Protein of unknown function [Porphyromonadaceae bacterium KH3CP3RA]|nr:Protein of unknown function [Porphyromonadaceae bacterium KH3CP3RA]
MAETLNPKDKVLLMREEGEGSNLKVVQGISNKGKIKAIDPLKAKQTDFLIIDKHADPIENFFKNFVNQAKNPSHTGFFAISVELLDKVIKMSDAELENYRVNPKDFLKEGKEESTKESQNQTQTQTTTSTEEKSAELEPKTEAPDETRREFTQFDTTRIPESEYQKFGITPEDLEKELNAMSYGFKSPHLIDINLNIDGERYPMQARLSLEEQPDGNLKIISYPRLNQVDLDKPFQGVILPDDVKENLLATGNGGRVVELEPKPGEKVPSLVSIDQLTNRLEAVPADKLNVSQNLKGVELTGEQQQSIKEGKKVLVEKMTTRYTMGTDNPRYIDAYVQFNAAKGRYDFTYDGLDRNRYNRRQTQIQNNNIRIPKVLLGVPLTQQQQDKLRNNERVIVMGMVKNGRKFDSSVKVDLKEGKFEFKKINPETLELLRKGPKTQSKKKVEKKTQENPTDNQQDKKKLQTNNTTKSAGVRM